MNDSFDVVQKKPLNLLDLDSKNPRFGLDRSKIANQTDILDFIVDNFGVDDVISSLAYNGYFDAEPIIAKAEDNGRFTVIEGNRRLAACLILSGSERAKNQARRTKEFENIKNDVWDDNTEIPVHVYEKGHDPVKLHSYLGVRHITSAKAWDSFAKAAWINDVVSSGAMTLEQISEVTGDKNRTIQRLLEGYNFIQQLVDQGRFHPDDSIRRGRGSNPEFPFSWVYTLLNYGQVRDWLEIEGNSPTEKNPIKAHRIDDAKMTMTYMFGDRSTGTSPAIKDSRQLGLLANVLGSPARRELLSQGKSIEQIEELAREPVDQLARSLEQASAAFTQAMKVISTRSLTDKEAMAIASSAKDVATMGVNVFKSLQSYSDLSFD
ncbi:hypothetical protein GCM10027202_12200 [Microvirgula curvata]